jgi:hypothetical protein
MISKATLENAKGGSEKILLIADEGMRKVVLGEELPRTSNAEKKLNEYPNFTTILRQSQKLTMYKSGQITKFHSRLRCSK